MIIGRCNMIKEISISQLFKAILAKLWLVVACAVVLGVGANVYANATTVPMYKSEALLYISNYDKGQSSQSQMSAAAMEASEHVLYRYVVLVDKADIIYELALEQIEALKVGYKNGDPEFAQYAFLADYEFTADQLRGMISVGQNLETEILSVYATASDPKVAQIVAHTVTTVLQSEIPRLLNASSNVYINTATYPTTPSSPVMKYTVIGTLLGVLLAFGAVVAAMLFDTKVRNEDDLAELFPEVPVLGVIPQIGAARDKRHEYSLE